MSHAQLFLKSDNPDDPIRVIAHVGRHLDTLKALGFVETAAEVEASNPVLGGDDASLAADSKALQSQNAELLVRIDTLVADGEALTSRIEQLEKENAELNELLAAVDAGEKPEGEQKRGPGRPKKADA